MGQSWHPMFWSDYAADVAHLSMMAEGAYIALLRHCYVKGNPVISTNGTTNEFIIDNSIAYRIAKALTPAEQKIVDDVLEEFFEHNGMGWLHNRVKATLDEAEERYQRRLSASLKGVEARSKGKTKGKTNRSTNGQPTTTTTTVNKKPSKEGKKKESKNAETRTNSGACFLYEQFEGIQSPEQFSNQMPPEWWEYARNKFGWPEWYISEQASNFWHHFVGETVGEPCDAREPKKKNWLSAWQRWVRTARKPNTKSQGGAGSGGGHDSVTRQIIDERYGSATDVESGGGI
jgi:uncharacterized protein YdaU (DUF1376 family)